MGLLILLFISISAAGLMMFREKLTLSRKHCAETFSAMKAALRLRHQSVRHMIDASQLYMLGLDKLNNDLAATCSRAEALLDAASSPQDATVADLDKAESDLTDMLQQLQRVFDTYPESKTDVYLTAKSENMDAAETATVAFRQSYNQSAAGYNRLRAKFPLGLFAGLLGHHADAGVLKFEDSNAAQMSRYLKM